MRTAEVTPPPVHSPRDKKDRPTDAFALVLHQTKRVEKKATPSASAALGVHVKPANVVLIDVADSHAVQVASDPTKAALAPVASAGDVHGAHETTAITAVPHAKDASVGRVHGHRPVAGGPAREQGGLVEGGPTVVHGHPAEAELGQVPSAVFASLHGEGGKAQAAGPAVPEAGPAVVASTAPISAPEANADPGPAVRRTAQVASPSLTPMLHRPDVQAPRMPTSDKPVRQSMPVTQTSAAPLMAVAPEVGRPAPTRERVSGPAVPGTPAVAPSLPLAGQPAPAAPTVSAPGPSPQAPAAPLVGQSPHLQAATQATVLMPGQAPVRLGVAGTAVRVVTTRTEGLPAAMAVAGFERTEIRTGGGDGAPDYGGGNGGQQWQQQRDAQHDG